MSAPAPKADANLDLVKAMGSKKGYDPIPPDQYNFFRNSPDGVQKILAYMRAHTIGLGCRSPYALAKNGTRPLTKADIARDCFNGDRGNAGRAWDAAEALGLVKCDEKGLLWLCGDVKPLSTKKPCGKVSSVQTTLSPYVIEQIESLPPKSREAAYADFARVAAFKKQIETDALNLARLQGATMEDSVFDFYALHKRRMEKKKRPDLHENGSEWLKLDLQSVPKELEKFVQTTKMADRTDHENGIVQTANGAGILISSEIQREQVKTAAAILSVVEDVSHALQIDAAAARHLVTETQKTEPSITAREIVQLCQTKMGQVKNQKIGNMVGLLLRSVPGMASGATLAAARVQIKKEMDRERSERSEKLAAIRENWENWDEEDRQSWLKEYPELLGNGKGAAA